MLTSSALAQKWSAEPTTFIGVELGAAYAHVLPACVSSNQGPGHPCVSRIREGALEILNAFSFDFKYTLIMLTTQGKVASFLLTTNQRNYGDLRRTLVERYGKPSKTVQGVFQTTGGGLFKGEKAMWIGKSVNIELVERIGEVDTSAMSISHVATRAAGERSRGSNLSKAAGQM